MSRQNDDDPSWLPRKKPIQRPLAMFRNMGPLSDALRSVPGIADDAALRPISEGATDVTQSVMPRVRLIDHGQKMMVSARATGEKKKAFGHRS